MPVTSATNQATSQETAQMFSKSRSQLAALAINATILATTPVTVLILMKRVEEVAEAVPHNQARALNAAKLVITPETVLRQRVVVEDMAPRAPASSVSNLVTLPTTALILKAMESWESAQTTTVMAMPAQMVLRLNMEEKQISSEDLQAGMEDPQAGIMDRQVDIMDPQVDSEDRPEEPVIAVTSQVITLVIALIKAETPESNVTIAREKATTLATVQNRGDDHYNTHIR